MKTGYGIATWTHRAPHHSAYDRTRTITYELITYEGQRPWVYRCAEPSDVSPGRVFACVLSALLGYRVIYDPHCTRVDMLA